MEYLARDTFHPRPCSLATTLRPHKVFERSIAGLRLLNAAGFGQPGSPLKLDLVYNPGGAFLPPSQVQHVSQ